MRSLFMVACYFQSHLLSVVTLSHSFLLRLPSLFSCSLSRAQGEMLTCPKATSWLPHIRKSTSICACLASLSVYTPHKNAEAGNDRSLDVQAFVQMSPSCLVNGCACPMPLETPRPSHYPEEPFLQLDSTPLTSSPAAH